MRVTKTRSRGIYPRIGLTHAYKRGGPVLKEDVKWWRINGFFFCKGIYGYWVEFFNHG